MMHSTIPGPKNEKPRNMSIANFYKQELQTFKMIIESNLHFKGKPIMFDRQDISIEESYDIFCIGHPLSHPNRKIHKARIETLGWIKEIIEHLNVCDSCISCLDLYVFLDKSRYLIYSMSNRYLIVLKDINTHFLIITAYPIGDKDKQHNKIVNKIEENLRGKERF